MNPYLIALIGILVILAVLAIMLWWVNRSE